MDRTFKGLIVYLGNNYDDIGLHNEDEFLVKSIKKRNILLKRVETDEELNLEIGDVTGNSDEYIGRWVVCSDEIGILKTYFTNYKPVSIKRVDMINDFKRTR